MVWESRFRTPPPRLEVVFDETVVAVLGRRRDGWYTFKYLPTFGQLSLAPLPGFPKVDDREYVSIDLFPFFAERIPELRRPEVQEWLKKHPSIDVSDKLGLLAALGKESVTDSYELRPPKVA